MNRAERREVLDCASPLALSHCQTDPGQSARGLAQSKTSRRNGSSCLGRRRLSDGRASNSPEARLWKSALLKETGLARSLLDSSDGQATA